LVQVFADIERDPKAQFEVNLIDQTFKILSTGATFSFEIGEYKKMCLENGYDDIDYLLSLKDKIEAFEAAQEIY